MTNILQGPWLAGITLKPRRRMTKLERQSFDRWLNWLAVFYAESICTGQPIFSAFCDQLKADMGVTDDLAFDEIQQRLELVADPISIMIDIGRKNLLAGEMRQEFLEPTFPKVWPDGFHVANIKDKIKTAELLRNGIEQAR